MTSAQASVEAALSAQVSAAAVLNEATASTREAQRESARLTTQVAALKQRIGEAEASLSEFFAGQAPSDPVAAVVERTSALQSLAAEERSASEIAAQAAAARASRAAERDRVTTDLALARSELGLDAAQAVQARAAELGLAEVASNAREDQPLTWANTLDSMATALRRLADATASESVLLTEARAAIADIELGTPAQTVDELADQVRTAEREADIAAATTERDAEAIERQRTRRNALEEETKRVESDAARYRTLATDLKADRIVDFLQGEALRFLAHVGSEHLFHLSDGRFQLRHTNDEFTVVDMSWGEEERSTRTLSGGETFLASLALAVALSDHFRELAVTDRARLDSLFLDEGFGSLDRETLTVAAAALERLGGDGRLVGVITHVREMAEQFPRIEVSKSAAGSRLERVAV